MSRAPSPLTPLAVLATLVALASSLTSPRGSPSSPMLTERLFDHPQRLHVSGSPPAETPRPAPSTSYRWTAEDLRSRWQRRSEDGYTTFTSPRVDIARMDLFDSIVIELARAPSRGSFSLLWSAAEIPSVRDMLRNRREIAVFAEVPRTTFRIRGDGIAPAIAPGAEPESPVRFLFLRFPENGGADPVVDSVTLLSKADALAGRPVGQARYAAQGQTRRAAYANGTLTADYETVVADGAELSFGAYGVGQAPLRVEVDTGAEVVTRSLPSAATWQDLRVPLPHSRGGARTKLTVSIASTSANDTVLLAEPMIVVAKPAQRFPNVILYVLDALRADHLGAYGYGGNTSPFLDSLARRGVLLRNCQAQAAWTKPSIASLLSSLHPQTHGVGARSTFDALPPSVPTLPALMRAHGYRTAQFTANPFASALSGLDRGFDEVFSPEAFETGANLPAKIHSDDINRLLLPWIEAHARDRFFAYVHSIDTHPPFAGSYDDEIRFNDAQIRRLYESLETLGLLGDTLLVVTADHGEAFGEHGQTGHGLSVHREEVHVPLLFFRPRVLAARVVEAPVESLDVMPTILDHCGIGYDENLLQGRSLRSASADALANRTVFSTRYVYPDAAELPEFFGHEQYAASQGRFKLIATRQPGRADLAWEVYDTAADRDERADVKASQADTLASLSAALVRFLHEQQVSRARVLGHDERAGEASANARRDGLPQETLDRLKSLGYLK